MGIGNNIKWVSLTQFFKIASQMIGVFVFSRVLTPKEIGIMSLVLVVVNFTNVIRDMGTSAALIQRKTIDNELKSTVILLNTVIGIVLFLFIFFFSDLFSNYFNQPELKVLLQVIAFTFPLNSFTSVHLSLLERDSKFNIIAKVEIFASIISLFTAIIMCFSGFGVISLVSQVLIYTILTSFLFVYFSSWKTSFKFEFSYLKDILPFTSNIIIFNFINYFCRNLDQATIGKNFSPSLLGQYSLAYRLMLFPVQNITFVLTRSLYPILSKNQDDNDKSFVTYLNILKAISLITPPLMLGLAAVADKFILVFFGNQWLNTASIIFLLAPVGILQSFVSTTGSVFMAKGKSSLLLKITIYNALLQISSFLIGVKFSLHVMLELYLIANILMFIPNMFLAVRLLHGDFKKFLFSILKPISLSMIMFCLVTLFSSNVLLDNDLVNLISSVTLGFFIYLILLFIFERELFMRFYTAVITKVGRG